MIHDCLDRLTRLHSLLKSFTSPSIYFLVCILSCLSYQISEARTPEDGCSLSGGMWNECASSCTSQCLTETGELSTRTSELCTQECVVRCECPNSLVFDGFQCTDPQGIVPLCPSESGEDNWQSWDGQEEEEEEEEYPSFEDDWMNDAIDFPEEPEEEIPSQYPELSSDLLTALWNVLQENEAYQSLVKTCTLSHYQSEECQDAWDHFITNTCDELEGDERSCH